MKTNIKVINGNQIGGCIAVISTDTTKIVIDFGESLPGNETEENIPFDWENEKVDAVFFTHYHGDHIGRFAEIPSDVPLYMGSVTFQVMKNIYGRMHKKDIVAILESRNNIQFIEPNKTVKIGDIEVTPYSIDHSAFDAYMFLIAANGEYILHTGDYRDHGHRGHTKRKDGSDKNIMLEVIKYYVTDNGKRKINALITEGTMMTRQSDNKYSEKQMLRDATEFFKSNKYVFLKISSTNVDSLASFAKAAKANGMKMYVNWYQMDQIEVYREAGRKNHTTMYDFENVSELFPAPDECKSEKQKYGSLSQRKEMREKGFVIVADGYYEKHLAEFSDLPVSAIYSMWHGYIEPTNKAYSEKLHDFCQRTNAISMHTSGHAYPEFIEQVINAVNPTEAIIPIHTEAKDEFYHLNLKDPLKERILQMPETDVLSKMKTKFGNKRIMLPRDIKIDYTGDGVCRMELLSSNIVKSNMQEECNAFEGWAAAIYEALDRNVKLVLEVDTPFELENDGYKLNGHFCRFLYRAMKYSEQYDWFALSEYLQGEVNSFKEYLERGNFTNNIPSGTAHENRNKECYTEARLAEGYTLKEQLSGQFDVGDTAVYRQLPVGLFENEVAERNMVFTGTKSAADLWNINGNDFRIYELKTDNKMVGIVTEVFFYSNYFRDLLVDGGLFSLNREDADCRGYAEILKAKITKIQGIMLADIYHPLVNDSVTAILNTNSAGIEYYRTTYNLSPNTLHE